MSLEEEFDGIIKQKANEINFPFDEKNWEKASALLDAERKLLSMGNKAYYVASIMGFMFIMVLVVGFNYLPVTIEQESLAVKHNIEVKQAIKNLDIETQKTSMIPQNEKAMQVKNVQKSPSQQIGIGVKKSGHSSTFSSPNSGNQTVIEQSSYNHVEENNGNLSNKDELSNIISENEHLISQQAEQGFDETKPLQENEFYMLPSVVGAFSEPNQEKEINSLPFIVLNCYDEDYYKKNAKRKTHYLNVELGGIYLLGWNTKNGKDGQGADWFGGFNYGLYLSKKISLSAGLQSYNIRNIHQAFYTNKKTEFDFGVVTSNTVITSNNLYYVALPFKINYAINSEHQIALGVNAGYAVGAQNTVQTYEMQEDNAKSNITSTKNTALYQNINSLNLMLTASYRVEIVPRLFLSGEFIYGVTDIFKNNKNIKNHEQPVGFRFGLQYNLFDK